MTAKLKISDKIFVCDTAKKNKCFQEKKRKHTVHVFHQVEHCQADTCTVEFVFMAYFRLSTDFTSIRTFLAGLNTFNIST